MTNKLEGNATFASFAQSEKAALPITVTPAGIVTLVSEEQPINKLLEIAEIPAERLTLAKDEQKENAPVPSKVTLDGMFKFVNPVHPEKAFSPIVVRPAGNDKLDNTAQF